MPFKFPYTNFHELNLDWVISKVKAAEAAVASILENGVKNPHKLIIHNNDTTTEYDGSEEKELTLELPALAHDLTLELDGDTYTYNGTADVDLDIDHELNKKVTKATGATSSLYAHSQYGELNIPLPLPVLEGGTGASGALNAGNNLKFPTAAGTQSFTAAEKMTICGNAGAVYQSDDAPDDIGAVSYKQSQTLTEQQKANVNANIGSLQKQTTQTASAQAYVKNENGTQSMIDVTDEPDAGAIAMFNASGNIETGTPYDDGEAVPLSMLNDTRSMISDAWTASTYQPGEYAIYNNKLWKCLVANSTAPVEGTNWTEDKVTKNFGIDVVFGESNDVYLKFNNGLLIARGKKTITYDSSTWRTQGPLYYAEFTNIQTFLIPFTSAPSLNVTKNGGQISWVPFSTASTTEITEIDLLRPTEPSAGNSGSFSWIAIGLWK